MVIKTEEEICEFLGRIRSILEVSYDNLKILSRADDKTRKFREQYNIKHEMVCEEILKLDILNYSYTDFDDDPRWSHEEVWIFGQTLMIEGVERLKTIYIKLKLRGSVVCMSFHPEEFNLRYPYL